MRYFQRLLMLFLVIGSVCGWQYANSIDDEKYWLEIEAKDKVARTEIANQGYAIEIVGEHSVSVIGTQADKQTLEKQGRLLSSRLLSDFRLDFPKDDSAYHNYAELTEELTALASANPDIVSMTSIGKSIEGRDIWAMRISGKLDTADREPGIIFLGGHHAREHLSVELPLAYCKFLVNEYHRGNESIVKLLNSRDVHIIPAVNVDGLEFDVATGKYKYWRKNRRLNDNGTYGVDLNRNYGYLWNTGGSSGNPGSDVYHGPTPFSEPETQAIKAYIENHTNISILLSFHTFSELILYPWGNTYDPIANETDRKVHETMAKTMAQWNSYKPQQSSDLYITSGDTTDWSYGVEKIFSFTFELDPKSQYSGGFYPGAKIIDEVIEKNLKPVLYLIETAGDPYGVLKQHAYRPY